MMIRRTLLVLGVVSLAGCATTSGPVTIADTAARTAELSTLNRLMAEAGLADTLRGAGPYTVFAPTDEAFKAVPAKTLQALAADKEQLRALLSYHVIAGRVLAGDVKNGSVKTVQGTPLALARAGGFVTVEEAMVQQADLAATNGVVHLIDRVLIPPKR